MLSSRLLVALGFAGALALPNPAAAQDESPAETLFNQGLEAMEAGNYEKGCPAIAESQRLDPRPGTVFTLAECEAKRGRIASVNDKFCAVFQFSREELLGADPRLLHAPPYPQDQLADALQALKDGEAWTDVISTWRRDGQEVRLRVTVTGDDGGAIVVGSVLQALKKPL